MPRGQGGGRVSQKRTYVLYISYIEQGGKTEDKGGRVIFRPKIVDVLYGRPLTGVRMTDFLLS